MKNASVPKITALVPMKGRSERVPKKNIKIIAGKPLFWWIISSLKKSKYILEIFVDTDSNEIAELCKKFFHEINIIKRPKKLRGGFVSMNKIIGHDLSQIPNYDYFLQTHSTNPLLKTETIDKSIEAFLQSSNKDSLVSVTRRQERFYDHRFRPVNHDPNKLIRTQDLKPFFQENSNIYIFSKNSFDKTKNRVGKKPLFFEIDLLESIDIDTSQDFVLAECLLGLKKRA